jgi:hypothetical protein
MLEARSPDITRIAFRGAYYKIWDAFPSISMAEQTAEDMRKAPYPDAVANHRCKVVTVDLGPAAGRLRYGVFIAKGARM